MRSSREVIHCWRHDPEPYVRHRTRFERSQAFACSHLEPARMLTLYWPLSAMASICVTVTSPGCAPASGATPETVAVTLIAAHLLVSYRGGRPQLVPRDRREGKVVKEGDITLIISVSANPMSMKAAIDQLRHSRRTLANCHPGRYELGVEAPHAHAGISSAVNTLDQVVMVGEGFRPCSVSNGKLYNNASDIDLPAPAAFGILVSKVLTVF